MAKLRGKALLPWPFVRRHVIPQLLRDNGSWHIIPQQVRKYLLRHNPNKDFPVGQISLRANEVCNLRCASCGQWGENGHLRRKLESGEKFDALDFDVVKRVVYETRRDKPFYYIWGGEPTMWRPLLPLFQELARYRLQGSIVTNAQDLDRQLEGLIDTGALKVLFLSLDGWDSESQNIMRSPARGGKSDNFEKTMAVIRKTDEIKRRNKLKFPLVIPISVVSNHNFAHLAQIHRLILDTAQLHP